MDFGSKVARCFAGAVFVTLLSACGGGGGGGAGGGSAGTGTGNNSGSSPVTPATMPGATFSPATITAGQVPGESTAFTFAVNFTEVAKTTPASGLVTYELVDNTGLWDTRLAEAFPSSGQFLMTVRTLPTVASGHYQGNVGLKACLDSACSQQLQGFPVLIPFDLTVIPANNLTPLQPLAGAGDWSMFGGNQGLTRFVPVTLDPTAFSLRWRWHGPGTWTIDPTVSVNTMPNSPAVTSNGMVYVAHGGALGYNNPDATMVALSENDGSTVWSSDLGTPQVGSYPAISGSRVFMPIEDRNFVEQMWSAAAGDGSQTVLASFNFPQANSPVPIAHNGKVFANTSAGWSAFDGATGNFLSNSFPRATAFSGGNDDGFPIAFDSQYGFLLATFTFDILDGSSGVQISSPPSPCTYPGLPGAEILAANDTLIMFSGCTGTLVSYNVAGNTTNWSQPATAAGLYATGNGLLYSLEGANLVVRNLSDGSTAWTASIPQDPNQNNDTPYASDPVSPFADMLVTNNLVFISTNFAVYAIDQTTHQIVWSYNRGGYLSLSANGVLYVSTQVDDPNSAYNQTTGGVSAFNLH